MQSAGPKRSDQVVQEILDLIVYQGYSPGDRMPTEHELAGRFAVSRNTVRAALSHLNAMGILETRRGDGTFVREAGANVYLNTEMPSMLLHHRDLVDLIELRKCIEVEAARLAAMKADADDVKRLEETYRRTLAGQQDYRSVSKANLDFHYEIVVISRNKLFASVYGILRKMLSSKMQDYLEAQGGDSDSAFYHGVLLECIRRRQPEEARFFAERHIQQVLDKVVAYQKELEEGRGAELPPPEQL